MTTLENLPIEVMIDILSRLPSESLFQFISVSKFWNALINNPTNSSFFQYKHILFMHLQKNIDSRETQLILSDFTLDPSMSLSHDFHLPLPFDWNQSAWSLTTDEILFPPDDDLDFYKNFYIHDHSHGIVCLTDDRNIILCNLTTREFRKLPPSFIEITYPSYDLWGITIGFGYDSRSTDFKVVRIVCYDAHVTSWRVEIFDLNKDRWRELLEVPTFHGVEQVPMFGVYHEGTLFWVSAVLSDESCYIRFLYSFDLSEEVFGKIPFPKSIEKMERYFDYWNRVNLGVLNGSIVIFHYSWQNKHSQSTLDMWEIDSTVNIWELESTLNIWKMEKNNESGNVTWSKLFTIDINSEIKKPLMFLSSNQFLMIKEGRVVLYNLKTQQFKEFPIEVQPCEALRVCFL